MNYKIVAATVLGLLINNSFCNPTKHFDILICNEIANAKTLYLKDIAELVKEKLEKCEKEVKEPLTVHHNRFIELLNKTEDDQKKIYYLFKDFEKANGSDLKKEQTKEEREKKEEETGFTEKDRFKHDELVYNWIENYHQTTIAYSELNYRMYLEKGKHSDLRILENFIENHTVHIDGFFTNMVKFAILIPVFLGIMQFA